MHTIEQTFPEIRAASRRNEDILGFVVTGSRGNGFANQWSDYDFAIFVTEEALAKYQKKCEELPPNGSFSATSPHHPNIHLITANKQLITRLIDN